LGGGLSAPDNNSFQSLPVSKGEGRGSSWRKRKTRAGSVLGRGCESIRGKKGSEALSDKSQRRKRLMVVEFQKRASIKRKKTLFPKYVALFAVCETFVVCAEGILSKED